MKLNSAGQALTLEDRVCPGLHSEHSASEPCWCKKKKKKKKNFIQKCCCNRELDFDISNHTI